MQRAGGDITLAWRVRPCASALDAAPAAPGTTADPLPTNIWTRSGPAAAPGFERRNLWCRGYSDIMAPGASPSFPRCALSPARRISLSARVDALADVAVVHLFRCEGQQADADNEASSPATLVSTKGHGFALWLGVGDYSGGLGTVEACRRSRVPRSRERSRTGAVSEGWPAAGTIEDLICRRHLGAVAQGLLRKAGPGAGLRGGRRGAGDGGEE